MPLGILSDEEFNKEVNNNNNNVVSKNVVIKEINKSGRNEGDVNKPESLRKVIAECKVNGAADSDIMEVFKTSPSSINAYSNGKNGTNEERNEKLTSFVKMMRGKITKRASRKLIVALDSLTEDKIKESKGTEISVIAKNLSAIISENEHKQEQLGNLNAHFHIYSPPQKSLDKYEVIDVNS